MANTSLKADRNTGKVLGIPPIILVDSPGRDMPSMWCFENEYLLTYLRTYWTSYWCPKQQHEFKHIDLLGSRTVENGQIFVRTKWDIHHWETEREGP